MSGETSPGSSRRKRVEPFGKLHPNWWELSDEELDEQFSPSPVDWKLIGIARNLHYSYEQFVAFKRIVPPTRKRFAELIGVPLPVLMGMWKADRWVNTETLAQVETVINRPLWVREESRQFDMIPEFYLPIVQERERALQQHRAEEYNRKKRARAQRQAERERGR